MHALAISGGVSNDNPICSKKSALPQTPETDLFPCLATFAPAAHAMIAAAVLILKERKESPPVPHVSMRRPFTLGEMFLECLFMAEIIALSSPAVSPFIERA